MKSCPYCGYQNDGDAKFCVGCGKLLPETEPTSPVQDSPADTKTLPVLIENDTPFNQPTLKKFYGTLKTSAIVMLVCGGILLLTSLLLILLDDGDEDVSFIWIACSVVFIVSGILYLSLYGKSTQKNKLITETSRQLYLFDEEGVKAIFSDAGKASSESYVLYTQITKVTKRKGFLLIWFGTTVWLIERNSFTKGTEEDLKALLKSKCPPNTVKLK